MLAFKIHFHYRWQMMKFTSYFHLVRIENGLIAILTIFVFQILTFNSISINFNDVILLLIVLLSLSAGNIINDIEDLDIDRLNNRIRRPLVSGEISLNTGERLYQALLLCILFFSFFLPLEAQILVILNNILLYLYSVKFKGTVLVGNISVAYLSSSIFLLCAFFYNDFSAVLLPAIFAFFIHLIRELVKDLEDIEGDQDQALRTFPIVFGYNRSKELIFFLSILLSISVFTLNFFKEALFNYNISMCFLIVLPLFVIYTKFVSKENKNNFSSASKYYKLLMLIGLIIILVFRNDLRFT